MCTHCIFTYLSIYQCWTEESVRTFINSSNIPVFAENLLAKKSHKITEAPSKYGDPVGLPSRQRIYGVSFPSEKLLKALVDGDKVDLGAWVLYTFKVKIDGTGSK